MRARGQMQVHVPEDHDPAFGRVGLHAPLHAPPVNGDNRTDGATQVTGKHNKVIRILKAGDSIALGEARDAHALKAIGKGINIQIEQNGGHGVALAHTARLPQLAGERAAGRNAQARMAVDTTDKMHDMTP